MILTRNQYEAVVLAMGTLSFDQADINRAMADHSGKTLNTIQKDLKNKKAIFDLQGGRGVGIADEIVSLRIVAAVLSAKPEAEDTELDEEMGPDPAHFVLKTENAELWKKVRAQEEEIETLQKRIDALQNQLGSSSCQ